MSLPSTYFVVDVVEQTTAYGRALNATFSYCRDDGTDFVTSPEGEAWPTGARRHRCLPLGVDYGEAALACEQGLIGAPIWYTDDGHGNRALWNCLHDNGGACFNPFLAEIGSGREYACPHREWPGVSVWKGPGHKALVDCRGPR